MSQLDRRLIRCAVSHLRESVRRLEICLGALDGASLWREPGPRLASPGNLVLHLEGNLTQYVLATLGGRPDLRRRSEEFTARPGLEPGELLEQYARLIEDVCEVLESLTGERLEASHRVQGFEMDGVEILVHVVEHVSYHVGQIGFWVKKLRDRDLGYYEGQDLEVTG